MNTRTHPTQWTNPRMKTQTTGSTRGPGTICTTEGSERRRSTAAAERNNREW